jgi:hypothetical protein
MQYSGYPIFGKYDTNILSSLLSSTLSHLKNPEHSVLCFITAPQMGYTLHSDASPLNKTVSHKKR